jgi:hypothetical protein
MPAYVAPHRRATAVAAPAAPALRVAPRTQLTAANLAAHTAHHTSPTTWTDTDLVAHAAHHTSDDVDTDVFGSDDESEASWAATVDTSATQFREQLDELLPGLSREDEHAMIRRAKECGAKVLAQQRHWLCYYDPEHGAFDAAFQPSLCILFSSDMADVLGIQCIEQGGLSGHEAAVLLWWRLRWLAIDNEMLRNGNAQIAPSCETCLREMLPDAIAHGKDFRSWPRTPVVTLFARTAEVACLRALPARPGM